MIPHVTSLPPFVISHLRLRRSLQGPRLVLLLPLYVLGPSHRHLARLISPQLDRHKQRLVNRAFIPRLAHRALDSLHLSPALLGNDVREVRRVE